MKNIAVRLSMEGGEILLRDLDNVGKRGEAALKRIENATGPATRELTRLTAAADDVDRSAGRGGAGIQNFAFQMSDFAVQVGAGTSAATALGQQLPQLLAGFGVLGAVIGAGVAVGVPLLSLAFKSLGGEARNLEDDLKALSQANADLKDAVELSNAGVEKIIEVYGRADAKVLGLIDTMARLKATGAATSASDLLSGAFSEFTSTAQQLGDVSNQGFGFGNAGDGLEGVNSGVAALRDELDLSTAAAERLQGLLIDASTAQGVREQADALARVREAIEAQIIGTDEVTVKQSDFLNLVVQIEDQIRQAAARVDELSLKTGGASEMALQLAASWSSVADRTAAAFAAAQQKIAAVRQEWSASATEMAQSGGAVGAGLASDFTVPGASSQPSDFPVYAPPPPPFEVYDPPASSSVASGRGSGGGGGGRSAATAEVDRQAEAYKRVVDGLNLEIAALGESDTARRIANESRRAGVDLTSAEGLRIRDLVEQLSALEAEQRRVADVNEFAAQSSAGLFSGMLKGADEARSAVARLADQLAAMAITTGFQNLFGGSLFGGSAAGGLLTSLFGIGARAAGGPVEPGKVYRVNEVRDELFVPTVPGYIRQFAPTGAGGGGTYNFAPVIDARGADQAAVARIEASQRAMFEEFRQTFRDRVSGATADPRLRGAF